MTEKTTEDMTIITIVISGSNVMGDSLCRMDGISYQMGKKIKEISFRGPITSGSDVMEAVSEMFEGGE